MELIGVVPRVELIEHATPTDIMNRPTVNEQILLSIYNNICHFFFKSYPLQSEKYLPMIIYKKQLK